LEVVEAISIFGQPELLITDDKQVGLQTLKGITQTEMLLAPMPART